VRRALRIRRFVLALCSGGLTDGAAPPPATSHAWALFLGRERCALPLQARLSQAGLLAALPAAARAALDEAALKETQRVLCAREQLARLATTAGEAGLGVTALKGAAQLVSGGEPLDLLDLDLLVDAASVPVLAEAGERLGYDVLLPEQDETDVPRRNSGTLRVELHTHDQPKLAHLALGAVRTRAAGPPGIALLPPADHLWHVLSHVAVFHPARLGKIRDLLLVAAAIDRCSRDERDRVERRLLAHPHHRSLAALAAAGDALAAKRQRADSFAPTAAAGYLLEALRGGRLERLADGVAGSVFALLAGRAALARLLEEGGGARWRLARAARLAAAAPLAAAGLWIARGA